MTSRRDKFPDQPEGLPLDIPGFDPDAQPRFNPAQRRAFGSTPALQGRGVELPAREHIPDLAWQRTEPATLRQGLFGEAARYAVRGIALSPEYYEAIVRHQDAFLASTSAKTVAANRMIHPERQQEKLMKSQVEPLKSKHARHELIIADLQAQQDNLRTLLEWQRTPGYQRTDETDLRLRTTQAWQQTFVGIIHTLKDNYELAPNDDIDMQQALAYRLTRDGSQTDRMRQWGSYLRLGADYVRGIRLLFEQSDRKIGRTLTALTVETDQPE